MVRRLRGEEHVGEEPVEGVARTSGPVLHVVAHSRLQSLHEFVRRSSQLLKKLNKELNEIALIYKYRQPGLVSTVGNPGSIPA